MSKLVLCSLAVLALCASTAHAAGGKTVEIADHRHYTDITQGDGVSQTLLKSEGAVIIVYFDDSENDVKSFKTVLEAHAVELGRTIFTVSEDGRYRAEQYQSGCAEEASGEDAWRLWCATVMTLGEDGKTMIVAKSSHARAKGQEAGAKAPHTSAFMTAFIDKAIAHKNTGDLLKAVEHDEL